MSNFRKLVEARMAETGECWQAASKHVRELVLVEEAEATKEFVQKLKVATRQPYAVFLGPRTIEPGQTIEMVVEVTSDDWPWSATRLEFIPALRGQSLFLESMTVGRRDQMSSHGISVPLEAFLSDVIGVNLGLEMITPEKPFKIGIRNAGTKPQLLIGHLSGIAHTVPFDEPRTSIDQFDIQRATLTFEVTVLLPHETKTVRIQPPREDKPPPGVSRAFGTYGRSSWATDVVADVEYTIERIMIPSFEGGFVDVRIDGESVMPEGFVDAERFGYSRSLARDFNTDRKPIEIKKPYIKDKTQIEIVVRNDSEHPHDFAGLVNLTRHLSAKEIEANQEARRNPRASEAEKHDERFPWNIEGKKIKEAVASGETKTFSGQPQLYFRGNELVVDPECRDDFEIVDVKVGVDPSPIFDKPISASRFYEDNKIDLKIEGAQPGIILRVIVKNISKETRDFGSTLKGIAIR